MLFISIPLPVEVEVYRRELPSLSIQFNIDDSSSSKSPNLADYNELSDVSEEYLHGFLTSAFEDVPVRHDGTVLFVAVKDGDPFTVDFTLTLEFIIPGEVPTIKYVSFCHDGYCGYILFALVFVSLTSNVSICLPLGMACALLKLLQFLAR